LAVKPKLILSWREFLQASWRMRKSDERLSLFQQAPLADHVMRQERAIEGDVVNGILLAGQSCGSINEIPTCQELIDGIVAQAEGVLNEVQSTKLPKNHSHVRFLSRIR